MAEAKATPGLLRFGRFDLSADTGELRKDGVRLKVSGQAIQVLSMLAANPGQLVTREELQQKLWPGASYGDPEHGLNAAVNKLRETLGDSATEPKYIETVPGRGYRFIAKIEATEPDSPIAQEPPKPRWKLIATITVVVCAVAAVVYFGSHFIPTKAKPPSPEIIPVVTLPGDVDTPSISPDGTEIAFAYQEEGAKQGDIFIKGLEDDRVTRLTSSSGDSFFPSWSPDGQQIAYIQMVQTSPNNLQRTIRLMTRLGGNQHLLRVAASLAGGRVSWTPDGKTLVYCDKPEGEQPGVFALSLNSSDVRRLTTSTADRLMDPAVSPDGKTIVFVRNDSIGLSDLYTVPFSGGEPRRLTTLQAGALVPVWTPDGRSIIFAADLKGAQSWDLYSVPATGGVPEPLPFAGFEARNPSISKSGDKLVLLKVLPNILSIWRMRLSPVGDSTKLIASTRTDANPAYSPNGTRIAFASTRDGTSAIWTTRADGSDPVKLASLQVLGGSPSWSPDGSRIAFDNRPGGRSRINVVGADGGVTETFDAGDFEDITPKWSADGKSIYFASNRSGRYEIWKKDLHTSEVVQITRRGGLLPQESPDGSYIYFIRPRPHPQYTGEPDRGLWRVSLAGGVEEFVLDGPDWDWSVTKKGVYFVDVTQPQFVLKFFDLTTRQIKSLKPVGPLGDGPNLAVSPDESSLLYIQGVAKKTDILLVKGMRW